MIINLSNSPSDLENCKLEKLGFSANEKLLDLTGTISEDSFFSLIDLRKLDNDSEIKSFAISEYIKYIGSLSRSKLGNRLIRSYQMRQLPVYWLTDISEKHPYYQPILNIFYLKSLILKGRLGNEEGGELKVLIPSGSIHYLENIQNFFKNTKYKVKVISFKDGLNHAYTFREYLSFLKQRRTEYLFAAEKLKKRVSERVDSKNLIFTTVPATWNRELKRDYSLGGIKDLSEECQKSSGEYLPFFTSFSDIAGWNSGFNYRYKAAFPSKFKFNLFLIIAAIQYWKISRLKCNDNTDELINESGLKGELLRVYSEKFYLLFNYIWFLKYFKSAEKHSNIFYQDELYHPGRVISQAASIAENSNICTYGVQHGIIMPGHTVYKVSNEETNTQTEQFDGFPLPKSFLVWGNYFATIVTKNSEKLANRTKVAGNANYITLLNKHEPKISEKRKENLNILWCTGLLRDVRKEYSFMKRTLSENNNYNLTIRFHPQHNLRNDMNKMLDSVIMARTKFSENADLFEDIKENDVVVTCSASTIYIDGLIFGKPVFSIDTDNYYLDKMSFDNLFPVKDATDFNVNYNKLVTGKMSSTKNKSISEFIYTNSDVWKSILTA